MSRALSKGLQFHRNAAPADLHLRFAISAPATKSALGGSPTAAPATKSAVHNALQRELTDSSNVKVAQRETCPAEIRGHSPARGCGGIALSSIGRQLSKCATNGSKLASVNLSQHCVFVVVPSSVVTDSFAAV